jgi:hypothetical protein
MREIEAQGQGAPVRNGRPMGGRCPALPYLHPHGRGQEPRQGPRLGLSAARRSTNTTREALRRQGEAMRAGIFGDEAGQPGAEDCVPDLRQLVSEAVYGGIWSRPALVLDERMICTLAALVRGAASAPAAPAYRGGRFSSGRLGTRHQSGCPADMPTSSESAK